MCALTRSKNRTTSCSFSGRRRHSTTSAPRPSGHGELLVDSPTQSLLPLAGVALEGTGAHNLGVPIHLARSSTCPRPGDRQYVHVSCCATSGYHECRGTLTWSSRICPPHRWPGRSYCCDALCRRLQEGLRQDRTRPLFRFEYPQTPRAAALRSLQIRTAPRQPEWFGQIAVHSLWPPVTPGCQRALPALVD